MNTIRKTLFAALLGIGCLAAVNAEEVIALPPVNHSRGDTVMQALRNRRSCREFSAQELPLQDISDLLWAANGFNRPGGHTNAGGKNKQSIEIYVCLKSGAYRYDPKDNVLRQVTAEDLRPAVADWQDYAVKAPVSLVVTSNLSDPLYQDEEWKLLPAYDAGIVSGNIYLFCSANGFGTICRTTMNREKLKNSLKLTDRHVLHLNHPVGFSSTAYAKPAEEN